MNRDEIEYMKGGKKPPTTDSSLLVSSSRYLNSWRLREVFAHDGLRKYGRDLPPAYLVPDAIQAFEEVEDYEEVFRLVAGEKARNAEFAKWLDDRFVSSIKADDLKHCKPGTLGAGVRQFIEDSGKKIDFLFLDPPRSDYEYLQKRRVQIHDIEHMVTGLGLDPIGESALILFNAMSASTYFSAGLAAVLNRFGMYLLSTGLMRHALHYPATMQTFLEAMGIAVKMGRNVRTPLFMTRWEDYWEWTIEDLREEFGLGGAPVPGTWDWTLEASKG